MRSLSFQQMPVEEGEGVADDQFGIAVGGGFPGCLAQTDQMQPMQRMKNSKSVVRKFIYRLLADHYSRAEHVGKRCRPSPEPRG